MYFTIRQKYIYCDNYVHFHKGALLCSMSMFITLFWGLLEYIYMFQKHLSHTVHLCSLSVLKQSLSPTPDECALIGELALDLPLPSSL